MVGKSRILSNECLLMLIILSPRTIQREANRRLIHALEVFRSSQPPSRDRREPGAHLPTSKDVSEGDQAHCHKDKAEGVVAACQGQAPRRGRKQTQQRQFDGRADNDLPACF